jgi:hypothetical protein
MEIRMSLRGGTLSKKVLYVKVEARKAHEEDMVIHWKSSGVNFNCLRR